MARPAGASVNRGGAAPHAYTNLRRRQLLKQEGRADRAASTRRTADGCALPLQARGQLALAHAVHEPCVRSVATTCSRANRGCRRGVAARGRREETLCARSHHATVRRACQHRRHQNCPQVTSHSRPTARAHHCLSETQPARLFLFLRGDARRRPRRVGRRTVKGAGVAPPCALPNGACARPRRAGRPRPSPRKRPAAQPSEGTVAAPQDSPRGPEGARGGAPHRRAARRWVCGGARSPAVPPLSGCWRRALGSQAGAERTIDIDSQAAEDPTHRIATSNGPRD